MKEHDFLIGGVGPECHFEVSAAPTVDQIVQAMEMYTLLEVYVSVSELDVRMTLLNSPAEHHCSSLDLPRCSECLLAS